MKNVKLADVAQKCGCSIATVSKALSDKSDIGEDTKERIRRVCEEMGYFPSVSARNLKSRTPSSLGVLLIAEDQSGITHSYFSHIVESFRKTAEPLGYDITFIGRGKNNAMSLCERAHYREVDGLFVVCIDYYSSEILELVRSDIPLITMDYSFDNCCSVVSDNIKGMSDLVEFICDRGHRRIAYVYGDNTNVTQNRVATYYRSMEERGIEVPDNYVRQSVYRDPKRAHDITMELLDLKNRPTCIIYPDDYSCIGGMNAIRERGFRIPEDISVAGYDGVYISQIILPHLTTIRQNTEEIGRVAADKLIRLIENPKTTLIEKIVVEGRLLEGGSVSILPPSPFN